MSVSFHSVQKIEVIVKGDKQDFVQDLLQESGATGYTLIRDIAGKGDGGFHEGRMLFNDQSSLVMFMAVATDKVIEKIAAGLVPLFEKNTGVMVVSEAKVARLSKFAKEGEI